MFSNILAAIDTSDHAEKTISLACDLARQYSAKLVFMYVVENSRLSPELLHMAEIEHLADLQSQASGAVMAGIENIDAQSQANKMAAMHRARQALAERFIDQVQDSARQKGLEDTGGIIDTGDPAKCILAAIEREKTDLVVLGSRGLSDLKGLLLGSVSHKVCQLAPCTCITVR